MTTIQLMHAGAGVGPIACTLGAAEYRDRLSTLSNVAARALRSREPIEDGARLVFRDDAATERELRTAVAGEAACCSFLSMSLLREERGLRLDVTGPGEAQQIIAELFA